MYVKREFAVVQRSHHGGFASPSGVQYAAAHERRGCQHPTIRLRSYGRVAALSIPLRSPLLRGEPNGSSPPAGSCNADRPSDPVSTGEWIVIGLRLAIPLLILRYPLFGGVTAMILDALDVVIIEVIGLGGFGAHYSEIDKLLDTYYLTLEVIVAFRWANPYARYPAMFLYVYRLIGVVIFEIIDKRVTLFIFPNLFENWWLYVVVVARFFPKTSPRDLKTTAVPLLLLLIPKMGQEYLLHYQEAEPWDWTKHHILNR
jgi:hypothetical protein